MAEIDTSRRVTRDIHLFDKLLDELPSFDLCITQQQVKISGSIATMENERRIKKVNDHIPLNLLEEIEHAKLVKRKKGSEVKTNLEKGRKVNNIDSSGCEKRAVQQEQEENEIEICMLYFF